MNDDLILVPPDKRFGMSYAEALRDGLELHPTSEDRIQRIEQDFDGWLRDKFDLTIPVTLPNGQQITRQPASEFWLVREPDYFIGRISIRHTLNDTLLEYGGHIGYAVRTTERKKGYATLMMQRVLPEVKKIGIPRALVTCRDTNYASIRIIEAAGGVLENKIPINIDGTPDIGRRYWITP